MVISFALAALTALCLLTGVIVVAAALVLDLGGPARERVTRVERYSYAAQERRWVEAGTFVGLAPRFALALWRLTLLAFIPSGCISIILWLASD